MAHAESSDPSTPSKFGTCTRWFSRYLIPKSGISARSMSPFCRFSASFSSKYDVTDTIRQDNEKMKVQYLSSLLFDLFEILQAVKPLQGISLNLKFRCYGNQNQKNCLLLKNRSLLFKQKCFSKNNLKQYSLIITAGNIIF